MTRIIITCAGKAHRWENKNTLKQLMPIYGEPLLHRTVRLLRKRGYDDIHIAHRNTQLKVEGCQHFSPPSSPWISSTISASAHLWTDHTIILLGDVYFSEEALDRILHDESTLKFCGRIGASSWTGCKYGELFALVFRSSAHTELNGAVEEALSEANKIHRSRVQYLWRWLTHYPKLYCSYLHKNPCVPIRKRLARAHIASLWGVIQERFISGRLWNVYCKCAGIPLNEHTKRTPLFMHIDDFTDDFDTEEQMQTWYKHFNMEVWCVTAFFAPFGSKLRFQNFERFAQGMIDAGVNLLTVELIYPWTTKRLPSLGNIITLEAGDILWHKEAMLNYGFSQLPESCDIAMYSDSDLLFSDPNWVEKLKALAQSHDIIQCFRRCNYLQEGNATRDPQRSFVSVAYNHSFGPNRARPSKYGALYGSPGGAWAFTKPHFRNNPLYDRTPIGNADCIFADGVFDVLGHTTFLNEFSPDHQRDIMEWSQQLPANRSVTYLPVDVEHLWHGGLKNRRYDHLVTALRTHEFDPKNDIKKINHLYTWASEKSALHQEIYAFFKKRGETETPTSCEVSEQKSTESLLV